MSRAPDSPESTHSFSPSESTDASVGVFAGRFKLREKLGEGGMGRVYVADQIQPVQRRVALKLLKADFDSTSVVARFEQERQALALMDHPNIAKVLDGGADEQGRPFLVMELVKGIPITQFCDQEHLTPHERLELFIPVCQAVQHAHQKGIIHRDLKPSNILVAMYDGKPVPKVIDFGVAKAVGQRLAEQTIYTQVGTIVGTLEYMAPEQAELNNLDIDTRSDIYSLGVVLYELLTGCTPFSAKQLRGAAFNEMLRIIKEVEPPKPSTRLSSSDELANIAAKRKLEPKRLTRLVHGDLDWIVMKCLEKERARRYETANGLATDLGRHLRDEPVSAGPPGTSYRLKKFLSRNKGTVTAAGLVLTALVLGIFGTSWGLVRAAAERDRAVEAENKAVASAEKAQAEEQKAKQSAAESKAVLEFFQNKVLAAARPKGQEGGLGHDATIRAALDAVEPTIAAAFADQPAVEASLRNVLSVTYSTLGVYPKAEAHSRAVLELCRRSLGSDSQQAGEALGNLAYFMQLQNKLAEAEVFSRQALEVLPRTKGENHPDVFTARNNLAATVYHQGRLAEAEALMRANVEAAERVLGPDHEHTQTAVNDLGYALMGQDKMAEAEPLFRRSYEGFSRKLGPEHPHTIMVSATLAHVLNKSGKKDEAVARTRKNLEARRRVSGPDHPDTFSMMRQLAQFLPRPAHAAEARQLLQDAIPKQRKAIPNHPQLGHTASALADNFYESGNRTEAEPLYREAFEIYKKALPQGDKTRATALTKLGQCLLDLNRHAEAETLFRELLAERERLTPDDWTVFSAKSVVGEALLGQKKYVEAEPLLLEGYEGMKRRADKIKDERTKRLSTGAERIVRLYDALGRKDESAKWRKEVEEIKASQ